MCDFRPVAFGIGMLLSLLAMAMLLPAMLDALLGSPDWLVFLASAGVTLFTGLALVLANRGAKPVLSVRQAFLLTTSAWLVIAAFAALPFAFSGLGLGTADAFFEAMSGITTTGSTVIHNLAAAPPGILLWRSILQWLGGIGMVVVALTVLPTLKIGGMQMFRMEGAETTEKQIPRAARMTSLLVLIYGLLTLALALALGWAGMNGFEAVNHAMTTISTGGFSTYEQSLAAFEQPAIHWITTLGMVLGGMPFLLFVALAQGRVRAVRRDDQLRWYLAILTAAALGVSGWLWLSGGMSPGEALRHGWFTTASFMTGTGFFTIDFSAWSGLPVAILFFLTFVGGCAGSTSAGIKVFRLHILFANARVQVVRLLRPHSVLIPYYNRKPISEGVTDSVMGFLFVYTLTFALIAMALAMMGLDFMTALSGAASAISNVGPGLGATIGPAGDFADLPAGAKWLLSFGMLLGRLELFTVLVLFVPNFWRA